MMSMAWGDGDGGVDGVAVAVVGVATKTRGGEWVWGSGRSDDGDPFWCWPKKPVGKVFRRRRLAGENSGVTFKKNLHVHSCSKHLLGVGRQETEVPQPSSPPHTNVADEAASTGVDVRYGGATTTVTGLEVGHGSGNIDKTPTMPHDSPLPRVNILGSDEGKVQGRHKHDMESAFEFTVVEEVYTTEKGDSTAEPVSTCESLKNHFSTASASSAKDKGKAIIKEAENIQTKTKLQQEQERLGYEVALRLQEQLDEEERQRIAKVHEAASSFNIEEWEDIQARIEADEELAHRLQAEETENTLKLKKQDCLQNISTRERDILPNKDLKKRGTSHPYKDLFETTMRRANTFVPMETEIRRGVPELVADSSQAAVTKSTEAEGTKRATKEELGQQSSKKQKSDELSQEDLQKLMIIVLKEGMNIEALQTKYPIIDWEDYTKDSRILVQERFNLTEPTEDKEIEIWVELKRLFEPDANDELWKYQKHIHDITWRLYDICRVHHVSTKDGMYIYMLVEREYPLSRGVLTQMLVAKLLVEQDNEISRELLRKIFMQEITPDQSTRAILDGKNVVPLRSNTIRLVQNRFSFHGLWFEDPNQHLKDFLKLVDSLDLNCDSRERMRLRLFQFSPRDQASNWLERLPEGSISTWEDLTTHFLTQFFSPGRLLNSIMTS
ncbi:hypothetical protein Tco_0516888 [Tanacetum coccineum]